VSSEPVVPTAPIAGNGIQSVSLTDPGGQAAANLVGLSRALNDVCALSRGISVSRWFGWDNSERGIHYYVLFWLGGLTLILTVGPTVGLPGWIMVGLGLYRLQDLTFSTLDNALLLSDRSRQRSYDGRTLIMLALVNIVQIVLIFAIAYLVLTRHAGSFEQPPTGRFGYFFLSWVSLPPLGGGAMPLSTIARLLTIGEEGTGLLIVVIAVGRFLSGPG
jgi:hypothetical protein